MSFLKVDVVKRLRRVKNYSTSFEYFLNKEFQQFLGC